MAWAGRYSDEARLDGGSTIEHDAVGGEASTVNASERMKRTNQELISSRARALVFASPLVVLLFSSLATTAHADPLAKPTNVVAREYLTAGNRFYRLREFEKAIEEYKAGAVREDAPVFYYNLGQCYRQLGRYDDAIWHYERFLERGKATGEVEASVRDFIARMKDELEKKAMKQPPVEPAPPSPAVMSPSPGPALPVRPQAEGPTGMSPRRKLAIGLGASGMAAIGLGVGIGVRARGFEADADELCPIMICTSAVEANALIDRGKTNAMYANLSLAAGAAATIGAVVLWLTGTTSREPRTAILPGFSGSSAHAGVTALGWF